MICPETLNIINTITNVIVALSASVAVITYFYNKDKDNVLAVVDQVSFFREKILTESEKLFTWVRNKDENYIFSLIRLDVPDVDTLKAKYPEELKKQIDLLKIYNTNYFQVTTLNLLEELSLRIIYSKTYKHKALNSIKPNFIKLVEMNALVLMNEREVITGNEIFSGTLDLYKLWKDEVDRSTPEERMNKIIKSYEKK